jgi:hypothetical protein
LTRKIIANPPSGTATAFGGEDINYINQLLTGSDQSSADPVSINTTWKFRSGKLAFVNPALTRYYIIAGSDIASNKTISFPSIGGDRAFVLANAVQTLTNKTMIRSPTASDTCIYPDAFVLPNLGKKKNTGYLGGSNVSNFGFGFGGISAASGQASVTFSSTTGIGRHTVETTAGTSGSQAGQRGNDLRIAVCRALRPRFLIKFRLSSTISAERFYCGLVATNSAFVTSTAPLDGPLEGYMLGYRAGTDTNWQIVRNDNSSTTTFSDTGVAVQADTIYTVELRAPAGDNKFQWSINGSVFADHTTDIPASTTAIYPQVVLETTENVAKTFHLFYWLIEIVDP